MKRLSTGFAGSGTKSAGGVDKEVEARLGLTRMDIFTDEFSPPGASEKFPGADFNKREAPYGDKHTDNLSESKINPETSEGTGTRPAQMAASGRASDQEGLDRIDAREKEINDASDNAKFDVHAVDPARLSLSDVDKLVEARLSRMVNGTEKSSNPDLNDERRFQK